MNVADAFIQSDLKWRREKNLIIFIHLADTFIQSDLL